ncbi:MAG: FHA domain-containing protein [Planctomycetota bacterium]|nr:MAG: FHA domain-containing protein [Planctomycetota bacterium]
MSVKLTLTLSGRTLERYEFDEADRIRIGRSEDCEITIDNLGVSRYHSEILKKDGFFVLRDLRSNNGTFVNGRRIDAHNLNPGDEISIGKFTLTFSSDEVAPAVAEPVATKPADDDFGGMTMQMDQAALAQLQREKASRVRGYLVVESKQGKKNVFLEKSVFLLGKSDQADIKLSGWFCPRKVAIIFRDESGFRLINVTPKGTDVRVNGKEVDDVRLGDNDEIQVRNLKMRFMRGTPVA